MDLTIISLNTWRRVMGYGRDKAYTAVREGRLKAFKGGKGAWHVPISELRDFPLREIEARVVPQ